MTDWREVAVDGETHLKRLMDMYKELDFEVRLEEAEPQEVEQCTQCLQQRGEKIYRVYARHKKEVQE
jgi:branched-subunit amino acid aminotransferase/4-amino-4-deoxychorismate lyase